MLTYANVGASYGGFNVLRDISFTISSPVVSGIFFTGLEFELQGYSIVQRPKS